MLVMSRTVGILTHAWTRVLTTSVHCSNGRDSLPPAARNWAADAPVAQPLARRLPPTPQSAKAKCVSL